MVRAGYGVEALDPFRVALVGSGGFRSWVAFRSCCVWHGGAESENGFFEEEDDEGEFQAE